ncbi:MAG: SusC/RagA family TonB-linked outer membrane protein [Sphingobacteriaceae bacterium]|nr:MAG: SusC/RagA family TonB-linked outer membrane protein [Sphingobacteriaceae bacterium]
MKKLLLVSLCFLLLCVTQTFAQNRTITGTVTAKEDGLPVPGVSVTVTGTQIGTQTNAEGKYTISVPASATTLNFSFIGYATSTAVIGSNTVVNATLSSDLQTLNEVVVTALGIQREKKDLGYAATNVTSKEINQASPVNVANGLQGKVSGLNITTINSGVFEDVKINLRGIRSLTGNNNPLLLIDGVPSQLSFLSTINPNDIESSSILKGASAAAVYGPDARNGVIVITTKRGSADGKPEVTIKNSTQFTSVSMFPKFQEKFGSGGQFEYTPYENWSWGPMFDGSTQVIGHDVGEGSATLEVPYTANKSREEFWNTGVTVQNDVSFAAKDFFMSIQDANVTGIVPDDKNRRTSIRVNSSKEYGRFKASFNTQYTQSNYSVFDDDAMSDYNAANNVGLNGGLQNLIYNTPAHVPLTSFKDFTNNPIAGYNTYFTDYGLNPYFALDNWRRSGKRENLVSVLELNFKAADWLNFTYRASLNLSLTNDRNTSKGEVPNAIGLARSFKSIPGALTERSARNSQLLSEVFARFDKTFADFKVNAVAGMSVRQRDNRLSTPTAGNLVVPELFNIGNRAGELTGAVTPSRTRLMGLFGSVGLSYKGWANVEVTGRNDRSSELYLNSDSEYSYFYPGVNASVVLTEAIDALKNNDVLSFFKLRGAWSKSGNADIGAYNLAATFSQGGGFPFGSLPGFSADNTSVGLLTPEFINSTEFGFDASFFKNRVNIEATYFHQNNTDQLVTINTSSATGYTGALVNAASFVNKGFEFDFSLTPLVAFKDGRINFKANATYNDSEVTKIYETLDELSIGNSGETRNNVINAAIVGQPAFVLKGTDYYRDDLGRTIVGQYSGVPTVNANLVQFGRTMPKWIVGLNPSVVWKGIGLSALFEYKTGHYAYHDIGNSMSWTGVNYLSATNDRAPWVLPNSSYETTPGVYVANTNVAITNTNNFFTDQYMDAASNFITSASSWRFRELSLSYDIPTKLLSKQEIVKGISVALVGRNLFLWVPKTNLYSDPDFTGTTPASEPGITSTNQNGLGDPQINPPVRTLGGSITIKF